MYQKVQNQIWLYILVFLSTNHVDLAVTVKSMTSYDNKRMTYRNNYLSSTLTAISKEEFVPFIIKCYRESRETESNSTGFPSARSTL